MDTYDNNIHSTSLAKSLQQAHIIYVINSKHIQGLADSCIDCCAPPRILKPYDES